VKDTGIGIAPENFEMIFDAFAQTDAAHKPQEGTGLGLTISRHYTRLMGGDISVDSAVGQGSTFRFFLPVAAPAASEIALPRTRFAPHDVTCLEAGQPVYRLLVVEDVETNRKLLVILLRSLGFEVREAANGQEAIAIWEEWRPHLIWMDIRMPVMDGREATRRIRAAPGGRETIIVALTASAFEEDRAKLLEIGCDDFVRKPFWQSDIVDILSRRLGARFAVSEREGEGDGGEKPAEQEIEESTQDWLVKALVATPPTWLADLRQATSEGDMAWMIKLIEHMYAQDDKLAGRLLQLADNFEHDTILRLIERAQDDHL
jgi:CheY-like chemotaxis protein